MNKKGLTLIELLSVMVVLAVVSLISIPIVKGIIENSRKEALRNSAYGIIEAAGYYYNDYMDEDSDLRVLTFVDGEQTDDYEKLKYNGTINHGFVAITPYGDVGVCIDDGKRFAKKDTDATEVDVDKGTCTAFAEDLESFITTGQSSYIGTRLSITQYKSKSELPDASGEGYVAVITDTEITGYYFSNDGIENPTEGLVWIVQNSTSDFVIENENSKLGVSCVMQYENGKWQPKEAYVYNNGKWVLLSSFDDLSNQEYVKHYDYTGSYQTFTAPYSGLYQVELWGAQGYTINTTYYGGKGAYTSGYLYLDEGESIYIYVGNQPTAKGAGWNGGGAGYSYYGGGGATDVRTVPTATATTWNELASLKSRIMVAGGGGGASAYDGSGWYSFGAAGGGLEGVTSVGFGSSTLRISPATQGGGGVTSGYHPGTNGSFGVGGNGYQNYQGNGGGGGWYGGVGGSHVGGHNSGGSSYISGHQGCGSVDKNGDPNGETVSWTGKYFTNTLMVDGTGYKWTKTKGEYIGMPNKDGSGEVDGNEGNGHAKISLVTPIYKSEETRNKEIENLNTYWSYGASTRYQTFTAPVNGTYRFELWGAQGGTVYGYSGGKGAYTKGDIYLEKGTTLYFYVGPMGTGGGAWNGGGSGYTGGSANSGGGGATDVRVTPTSPATTWNEINSLRSRIMVAASGAGASSYDGSSWYAAGGAGGGLTGLMGEGGASAYAYRSGTVASQGMGGTPFMFHPGGSGYFGGGGNGYQNYQGNGGGSGWYGGAGGSHVGAVVAGGSSYISGHLGCNSLNENGVHNGSAFSYTDYIFTDTEMIDGEGYEWTMVRKSRVNMKQHLTTDMVDGNTGAGYARVMLVKKETKTNYVSNLKANQKVWTFSSASTYQPFVVPKTGTYKVELWGAQGGSYNTTMKGGLGAYTSGNIKLTAGTTLYLFVGGAGGQGGNAGYNGGGAGYGSNSSYPYGYSGGGSTDIRVLGSDLAWNNANSLNSRIMVAAGGAGASSYDGSAWTAWDGAGGGLEGILGNGGASAMSYKVSRLPNQTVGGISYTASHPGAAGAFGVGGNGYQNYACNGGGGGWYGAAGGAHVGSVSSGGSSYISGHKGCIAVDASGAAIASEATTVNDSYSYTGYKFTNTKMIDGEGYNWTTSRGSLVQMPTYDGSTVMTGNEGHGFAKITFVK